MAGNFFLHDTFIGRRKAFRVFSRGSPCTVIVRGSWPTWIHPGKDSCQSLKRGSFFSGCWGRDLHPRRPFDRRFYRPVRLTAPPPQQ